MTDSAAHPQTRNSRGLFVVFEGLDRSGKSTQVDMLIRELRVRAGREDAVTQYKFPDRNTPTGQLINDHLTKKITLTPREVHEKYSLNRWEKRRPILEELQRGAHVVCDRYAFSGTAYSVPQGLDLAWCMSTDSGLPAPDFVFFLDVDPVEMSRRPGYGEERYERVSMQQNVKAQFERIRNMICPPSQILSPSSNEPFSPSLLPEVPPTGPRPIIWVHLDGRASPEAVHSLVMSIVSAAAARTAYTMRDPLVLEWGECSLDVPAEYRA